MWHRDSLRRTSRCSPSICPASATLRRCRRRRRCAPSLTRAQTTMAEHGHERFHVAGNSLGGGIALHLALDGRALSRRAPSPPSASSRAGSAPSAARLAAHARGPEPIAGRCFTDPAGSVPCGAPSCVNVARARRARLRWTFIATFAGARGRAPAIWARRDTRSTGGARPCLIFRAPPRWPGPKATGCC